jgi:hypothetical protein
LSTGSFFIQGLDQTLAKALEQGRKFSLRAGRSGPARFLVDDMKGPDKAHFRQTLDAVCCAGQSL